MNFVFSMQGVLLSLDLNLDRTGTLLFVNLETPPNPRDPHLTFHTGPLSTSAWRFDSNGWLCPHSCQFLHDVMQRRHLLIDGLFEWLEGQGVWDGLKGARAG